MIRGVLVDRSNNPDVFRWCEGSEELRVSILPDKTDLRETLLQKDYDFCIVHENSDESTGIEIVRQIHTLNPLIPIIFLTDLLDVDLGARILKAGADSYLWDITREHYQNLLVPAIKNIVQHRKTEAQVIQDNILMRTIHDTSPIAACVIQDHRIIWMNAIIPKKLGYTENELIGSDSAGLFPDEEEHHRIETGLYESSTEGGVGYGRGSDETERRIPDQLSPTLSSNKSNRSSQRAHCHRSGYFGLCPDEGLAQEE